MILQSVFGTDWFGSSVRLEAVPGVERSVLGLLGRGGERRVCGRIYAGQQTRPAEDVRHRTGRDVAHGGLATTFNFAGRWV